MENKFYVCSHCGNVIEKLVDSGVPVVCCGEPMKELVANTTEAATEKHIPVVEVNGNKVTVTVGEVIHPMTEAHLIQWIMLKTNLGTSIRHLSAIDQPVVVFELAENEKALEAYEYCNLHGLWKATI